MNVSLQYMTHSEYRFKGEERSGRPGPMNPESSKLSQIKDKSIRSDRLIADDLRKSTILSFQIITIISLKLHDHSTVKVILVIMSCVFIMVTDSRFW